VTLGGTTLVAHLTPGHTAVHNWTMKAQENGKTYDVVFNCSLRPPATLTPALVDQFNRSFKLVRALRATSNSRSPGPVQPATEVLEAPESRSEPIHRSASCQVEADIQEAMFHAILAEQATQTEKRR